MFFPTGRLLYARMRAGTEVVGMKAGRLGVMGCFL